MNIDTNGVCAYIVRPLSSSINSHCGTIAENKIDTGRQHFRCHRLISQRHLHGVMISSTAKSGPAGTTRTKMHIIAQTQMPKRRHCMGHIVDAVARLLQIVNDFIVASISLGIPCAVMYLLHDIPSPTLAIARPTCFPVGVSRRSCFEHTVVVMNEVANTNRRTYQCSSALPGKNIEHAMLKNSPRAPCAYNLDSLCKCSSSGRVSSISGASEEAMSLHVYKPSHSICQSILVHQVLNLFRNNSHE